MNLDAVAVVATQRVVGVELEGAVGTDSLPVRAAREHDPAQPVATLEGPSGEGHVPPLGVDHDRLLDTHRDREERAQVHGPDPGALDALLFLSVQRSRSPGASRRNR